MTSSLSPTKLVNTYFRSLCGCDQKDVNEHYLDKEGNHYPKCFDLIKNMNIVVSVSRNCAKGIDVNGLQCVFDVISGRIEDLESRNAELDILRARIADLEADNHQLKQALFRLEHSKDQLKDDKDSFNRFIAINNMDVNKILAWRGMSPEKLSAIFGQ